MKKDKIRNKMFSTLFIISFAIFLTMFYSNKYGYYEYKKHEQIILTQEQILKFEQDVRNGKQVNLEKYLENTNNNYQTKMSKTGLQLSNTLSKVVKKSVDTFFKYLSKYMIES